VEEIVGVDDGGTLKVVAEVTDEDEVVEVVLAVVVVVVVVVVVLETLVEKRFGGELGVAVERVLTKTVETTVLCGALDTVEGMGIEDVADGSGVENEPSILSRVNEGEKPWYGLVPFVMKLVDIKPM